MGSLMRRGVQRGCLGERHVIPSGVCRRAERARGLGSGPTHVSVDIAYFMVSKRSLDEVEVREPPRRAAEASERRGTYHRRALTAGSRKLLLHRPHVEGGVAAVFGLSISLVLVELAACPEDSNQPGRLDLHGRGR